MSEHQIFKAVDSVSGCTYEWTLDENGEIHTFDVIPPRKPKPDMLVHQKRFAESEEGTDDQYVIEFKSPADKPVIYKLPAKLDRASQKSAFEKEREERAAKQQWKIPDEVLEDMFDKYATDYTELAKQGHLMPVVGRDEQLQEILTILLQKGRSNACVLGDAGTGKTAMFVATAIAFANDEVPERMRGGRVLELDLNSMAAGTESKSEVEERLIPVLKGCAERNRSGIVPPIILCLDEVHSTLTAGQNGLAETLKPYLTQGEIQIIGATTKDEYKKYIQVDEALDRRFQKVVIEAPNDDDTIAILETLKKFYTKHHKLEISTECVEIAVVLSSRYMKGRNQPDKALMVMDGACAKAVKKGRTGDLLPSDVTVAVAAETGINPAAMEDEIQIYRDRKKREELEDQERRERERDQAEKMKNTEPYDPVKAQMEKEKAERAAKQATIKKEDEDAYLSDEEKLAKHAYDKEQEKKKEDTSQS